MRPSRSGLGCVVIDINVAGEESSPGLGARVRVSCSVRFTAIWRYI